MNITAEIREHHKMMDKIMEKLGYYLDNGLKRPKVYINNMPIQINPDENSILDFDYDTQLYCIVQGNSNIIVFFKTDADILTLAELREQRINKILED